jgi:hypothetical protein
MSIDESRKSKIIAFRTTGYNLEKMEISNTLVFNAEVKMKTSSDTTVKTVQGFAYVFDTPDDAMIFVSDNVAYRIV